MTPRPAMGRWFAMLLVLLHAAAACLAVDLRQRSTSSSGQFVVYCDNRELRTRVVSFVEEVKTDVLRALREGDDWKMPLVVTIEPETDPKSQGAPVRIQLVNTVAGPKIDIAVRVGDDPSKIFLQRHIVRALLLEIAYRDQPRAAFAERTIDPPWWLSEGLLQGIRSRAGQRDQEIFRSIVNTEKFPPLDRILTRPPLQLDTAVGTVDRACALGLVEALLRLPSGPANLGRFLRAWPTGAQDPQTLLAKHFPVLAQSPQSLAKWWMLQLAALGKSNSWQGLSPAEADAELRSLLTLDMASGKPPRNERFPLADFEKYIRLPGAKPALRLVQTKIGTLASRAHPLFQPILAEYEEVCGMIASGKTKGLAERLANIERFRAAVLQRHEMITDYLNWYEATQTAGTTGEFERYFRAVENMEARKNATEPVDPKIADFLDSIEQEFAPLRPNTMPGVTSGASAGR